jgi:chromosome segregation ATPase
VAFNDLATMIAYFVEQQGKIDQLLAETDEINQGVTAELVEAQDRTEAAFASAVALADDAFPGLDAALRQTIEARLPTMREEQTQLRADLEQLIGQLEEDRAEIEQKDAAESAQLATDNPNLNEREEILKHKLAEAEAALAATEGELVKAGSGLGWLVQAGRITRLRKQHQAQATALYGVRERLSEVRNAWAQQRSKAVETEGQLQQAWRLRTAEIAKLNQELSGLNGDFEGACRRAALQEWMRAQDTFGPAGAPEVDAALQEISAAKQRAADCEEGVIAVSQIMGLLKGVREGMERMQSSIEGVKKEQDMHSELSTLRIEAPPAFVQFHQFWDALLETVRDEKRSIEHPKAFADIIDQVVATTLSNESIEAMFTLAGNALTEATKQWD